MSKNHIKIKLLFLILFIGFGIVFNVSSLLPKQAKIIKEKETLSLSSKTNDFYAGETIKYGDFVHKSDSSQGVFFAVHYIDPSYNTWRMNDLEFPELSYSQVDYESNVAEKVDTVVEFGYAGQSFYIYGEGIKGHYREYEPGFFIFPDTNYSPSINIKKSTNGFTYLGYTLHGFSSYPSGNVPTRSVITDLTKNYIYDWNIWTGKQKTDMLDGKTNAKVTKDRSILVNIYFYKSSDITIEANDPELGSITTDEEITNYQDGQTSITIENCPIGTEVYQLESTHSNCNWIYRVSYSYHTYKDNKEYNTEYTNDFCALEKDQVYIDYDNEVHFLNNLNAFFSIPFKLETNTLSFNIELDVSHSKNLYFYASYGKYESEEVKVTSDGKQTITITIEDIPAYYKDDLIIHYIYKDINNRYINPYKYCISPDKLDTFNYITHSGNYITLLSDYYLEYDTIIEEPVGYMYEVYSVSYTSFIEDIKGLPQNKFVLHNSTYEIEKNIPIISDTEHEFVGYRCFGSDQVLESIVVNSDLILSPLYSKKQISYLTHMDSTITEITGIKYTSNLKTYFNASWDINVLPFDTTVNSGYSFIYWIKDKVSSPYDMEKITNISELEDGHTYYSIAFKAYKAKYIINTNNSIYGYSYHTSESGYAKYLISNGSTLPTYYSDITIDPYGIPTATNGTFLGYSMNLSSDELYQPGDAISVAENIEELVFYAKWDEIQYELTIIYFNQGDVLDAEIITGSYNETITIEKPVMNGYTFKNFRLTNQNYSGKLSTYGNVYRYTFGTTNDTIEASWTIKSSQVNIKLNKALTNNLKFTIEFYNNDTLIKSFTADTSSNSLYSINAEYNSNIKIIIRNENYKYNISFEEPTKDSTKTLEYNHLVTSDEINLLTLNVTQLYVIKFDGNKNTCDTKMNSIYKLHNVDIELPTNPFEREDFVASGWSYSQSSITSITTYKENKDRTFYSFWLSKITFHTGDDEFSITVNENSKYDLPVEPKKEGYNFLGWSCKNSTALDWTSGSQEPKYKHWYAVWEGLGSAQKQEVAYTVTIYAEPYDFGYNLYSYKVDLYENVLLKFNYTLERQEVINYDNATIVKDATYYTPIEFNSAVTYLPIAGYSQDINSLTPTWTEGNRYVTSDEVWYAICYYVSDIKYEVTTLTHKFYIGKDNYFTKETTITTPTSAKVLKKNFGETLVEETDEYTNFGNIRYSELSWQTVTLSEWGQVDKDFSFKGWSDKVDSLEVVWDSQRGIVPHESQTYYAIYCESKTRYVDVTEFDVTFNISDSEVNTIKASRTTHYIANNICNFDNSCREVINTVSVDKQVGTTIELPNVELDNTNYEFAGWSTGSNYFDQINKVGKSVELRSDTTYYAVYKMMRDECLDVKKQTYYFVLNPYTFNKLDGQVEYIYKNVVRYYNYNFTDHTKHYLSHEGLLSTNELPLEIPNYDGNILGWNSNSRSTEIKYTNIIESPQSTYYYAIWNEEKQITITYSFFEGFDDFTETKIVKTKRNYDGKEIDNPEVIINLANGLTSKEFNHEYWYMINYHDEIKYDLGSELKTTYNSANDLILYGKIIKKNVYLISYLDDTPSFVMYENEELILKECELEKEHQTFSHWNINGINYNPNDKVIITDDIYITPIYTPIPSYLIQYTETDEKITLYKDDILILPNGPDNDNMTFEHWLVNDVIYYPNDEIIINENLIITPIYKQTITYNVTYSNSLDVLIVEENNTITLLEPSTIEGYEFECYSVNGQTYNVNDTITITDDTHIELVYKNLSSSLIEQKEKVNYTSLYILIAITTVIIAGASVSIIIIKKRKNK